MLNKVVEGEAEVPGGNLDSNNEEQILPDDPALYAGVDM